jgi:hypothetical protein
MSKGFSLEANIPLAGQEVICNLCNLKGNFRACNTPQLVPILIQLNVAHSLILHCTKFSSHYCSI